MANENAIRAYAKVGFRPVGVMRSYERNADGTWHDNLLMDLLGRRADVSAEMAPHDRWDPGQYNRFKDEREQPFWDLAGLLRPVPSPPPRRSRLRRWPADGRAPSLARRGDGRWGSTAPPR